MSSEPAIVFRTGDYDPLVVIHQDGSITYGKDYSPDVAAAALWDAIAEYFSDQLEERWNEGYNAGVKAVTDMAKDMYKDSGSE